MIAMRIRKHKADTVCIACRRKSLRLQKLAEDTPDTSLDAETSVAVEPGQHSADGGACDASIEDIAAAEEGDDFFSPFPDPDLLSQVEDASVAATSRKDSTEFQAARRRHSVMPGRRSDPPLVITTSSESTEGEFEQEQAGSEEAATRKPASRLQSRVSARTAPARASTRRKTR